MKRRIVLLGPPASGKGTQAEMITAKYGIPSASPGAMFRSEKAAGSKLGVDADQLTRDGKLLPDSMVCGVVDAWLNMHDGEFVFDGFPRSLGQAAALADMLDARRMPLEIALFLDADFATIASRVEARFVCSQCHSNFSVALHAIDAKSYCPKCGGKLMKRSDDNLQTLQQRMREYWEKTEPLIAHYRRLGLLRTIYSTRPPYSVFETIVGFLEGK